VCEQRQGPVKVVACIEDPVVIQKILIHLQQKVIPQSRALPPASAPPQPGMFEQGLL